MSTGARAVRVSGRYVDFEAKFMGANTRAIGAYAGIMGLEDRFLGQDICTGIKGFEDGFFSRKF